MISTYGDQAIGAPSVEMYIEAYTAKYGANSISYRNGLYGLSVSGKHDPDDRAFSITDTPKTIAWLSASPSYTTYTSDSLTSYYLYNFQPKSKAFGSSLAYIRHEILSSQGGSGLRPVVRLKKGVKIVEKSDGTYGLSY